jgi:hypothetical protein
MVIGDSELKARIEAWKREEGQVDKMETSKTELVK